MKEKKFKAEIKKEIVISDDLFFNIVKDFEKKNITTEDKGKFIQSFLDKNNISQRQLAKLLNIPYSTFHDWISQRQKTKYYEQKQRLEVIEKFLQDENVDTKEFLNTDNPVIKKKLCEVVRNIGVYSLANRLYFLISRTNELNEKEFEMLLKLKSEIDLLKLRLKK